MKVTRTVSYSRIMFGIKSIRLKDGDEEVDGRPTETHLADPRDSQRRMQFTLVPDMGTPTVHLRRVVPTLSRTREYMIRRSSSTTISTTRLILVIMIPDGGGWILSRPRREKEGRG